MAGGSPRPKSARPSAETETLPAGEALSVLAFASGYNSSVVLAGVVALGIGAGVAGVFPYLRRRALVSDAISHATLPGVALGFLAGAALGGGGKNLPLIMLGAAATGILGLLAVRWIRDRTRLTEDTAIGSVLSVFFGLGIVLLSHVQTLDTGGQAGLNSFLLGSTATLSAGEAWFIGGASLAAVAAVALLLKEFRAVAFDETFAAAAGWNVARIDLVMLGLLLVVIVTGLRTVGLVLILALVIIPPCAARLWTDRLALMVVLSGAFGGLAGWTGGAASAVFPDLPAGSMIVVAAGAIFAASLLLSPVRGLLARAPRRGRVPPPHHGPGPGRTAA